MYLKSICYFAFLPILWNAVQANGFAQQAATQAGNATNEVLTYHIQNIDCTIAQSIVDTVLAGRADVRMAMDPSGNSLIIMGDSQTHKLVADVLSKIDVARADTATNEYSNVAVQVLWIVDVPNDRKEEFEGLKQLPSQINELVAGELGDRLALTNPMLGTQLYLNCQPDSEGNGQVEGRGNGNFGMDHAFNIQCNTDLTFQKSGGYTIELDIQASVDGNESNVSTRIRLLPEHPVCVAVAPIGGVDSLFIVRVY